MQNAYYSCVIVNRREALVQICVPKKLNFSYTRGLDSNFWSVRSVLILKLLSAGIQTIINNRNRNTLNLSICFSNNQSAIASELIHTSTADQIIFDCQIPIVNSITNSIR